MAQPASTSAPAVQPSAPSTVKPPEPSTPTCIACCEEPTDENAMLKPCRTCQSDYCQLCVARMFTDAVDDPQLFPPKCCSFLQVHTALAELSIQAANDYRQKLDEHLTVNKLYCPAPTCSAFIPERVIPPAPAEGHPQLMTLQSVLEEVIQKSLKHPSSRFIRKRPKMDESNGFTAVDYELGLYDVEELLKANAYTSAEQLTADITRIVTCSKARFPRLPSKPEHPIYKTADDFFQYYVEELSLAIDGLAAAQRAPIAPPSTCFTCPKCHIGICTKCKHIEHSPSPCDTSAADLERAMLMHFGYKRCPACRHAVKKMFGCSHMQCRCGAHWCYGCQKSINHCDGGCDGDASDEDDIDDEEDDFGGDGDGEGDPDEDDEDEPEANGHVQGLTNGSPSLTNTRHGTQVLPLDASSVAPMKQTWQTAHLSDQIVTAASAATTTPNAQGSPASGAPPVRNLDGGGSRRWAGGRFDFGEEPQDEGLVQVWSCYHIFAQYAVSDDGHDHGDLTRMECNRCFSHVVPAESNTLRPTKNRGHAKSLDSDVAWECVECKILVCLDCRRKYYKDSPVYV